MPNHVSRYGWSLHNDALRPSLLGRAAGRRVYRLPQFGADDGEKVDEAPVSPQTQSKMHEAIDRLGAGAVGAAGAHAAQAIDEAIRSFRNDNAAGGRGVFEHLPLPNDLARTMASHFDGLGESEKQPAFDGLIRHLEPSARTLVAQQISGLMERQNRHEIEPAQPVDSTPRAKHVYDVAEEDTYADAQSSASRALRGGPTYHAELSAASSRRPMSNGEAWPVQRGAEYRSLSAPGRRPRQDPVYTEPSYDGVDEADWREQAGLPRVPGTSIVRQGSSTGYPPEPKPKPRPNIPGAPAKYQPEGWYQRTPTDFSDDPANPDVRYAMTERGKVLLSPHELTKAQQDNLFGQKSMPGTSRPRRWIKPTDTMPGDKPLRQGFGYFGARRVGRHKRHHGGLDFVGTEVRMPTDARLVGVEKIYKRDANGNVVKDRNNNPVHYGYTLTFDLGDGMQLALLHVNPSQELLDRWEAINGRGRRLESAWIPLGAVLGEVDRTAYEGKGDHVHMQITMDGGTFNGAPVSGFAVDPTTLFPDEERSDWWLDLLRSFGLAD